LDLTLLSLPLTTNIILLSVTQNTQNYSLSLHDALPIYAAQAANGIMISEVGHRHQLFHPFPLHHKHLVFPADHKGFLRENEVFVDRKSTRLNSSHVKISYAVFCLKKKKILTFSYQLVID